MKSKLGRNDKCWCGSGKKYKRCHLDRASQKPPTRQDALKDLKSTYEQGVCLHPDASHQTCKGGFIRAHTIQRSGGLSALASGGHVYSLLRHGKSYDKSRRDPNSAPQKVGVKEASTFRGFCSRHDNQLFMPIEKEPFTGTTEQIALFGYRAICYETYMKGGNVSQSDFLRTFDKGLHPQLQVALQEAVSLRESGARKAYIELQSLKALYERMLFDGRFGELGYFVVSFSTTPEVASTGALQATHDFQGNRVHQLGHLGIRSDWLTFTLTPTDNGGAAVFTWPTGHEKTERVMATLNNLPNQDLPHAILRFAFEFIENTYFSPEWWDGLEASVRARLKQRQLTEMVGIWGDRQYPRVDSCLADDGIRAVSWTNIAKQTSIQNTS